MQVRIQRGTLLFKYIIFNNYIRTFIYTDTTFAPWQQDNGHVVLNTKPKILCCDLRLSPGGNKTCKFVYKNFNQELITIIYDFLLHFTNFFNRYLS